MNRRSHFTFLAVAALTLTACSTNPISGIAQAEQSRADEAAIRQLLANVAYEHGTYALRIADKKTGKVLQDVKNKHVHILKRQPDGSWKTWRMIVTPAEPASAPTER
jgi:hypothetical protein